MRDPADPARLLFAVRSPGGVSTSGLYERGAHVRDPLGGGAASAAASATVAAPDLDLGDALATALVASGAAGLPLVDRIAGAEACILTPDGRLHATPGFPFAT